MILRQAEALAGVGAGRGRPVVVNHRRAVSAAYYALFHAVCLAAARNALPDDATEDEVYDAVRWIDHKDVERVCRLISSCQGATTIETGRPAHVKQAHAWLWEMFSVAVVPGGGRTAAVPADLQTLVSAFPDLQEARHAADCDDRARFP